MNLSWWNLEESIQLRQLANNGAWSHLSQLFLSRWVHSGPKQASRLLLKTDGNHTHSLSSFLEEHKLCSICSLMDKYINVNFSIQLRNCFNVIFLSVSWKFICLLSWNYLFKRECASLKLAWYTLASAKSLPVYSE